MIVRTCLKYASTMLDREDLVEYFSSATTPETLTLDKKILLDCYNVVQDEIAREYVPVIKIQTFNNSNGRIYYASFYNNPLKILQVKDTLNNIVKIKAYPDRIELPAGSYVVTYSIVPEELGAEDTTLISSIGARIIAYGIASEFCFIKGLYEEASIWHQKYINALKTAFPIKNGGKLPCREWF